MRTTKSFPLPTLFTALVFTLSVGASAQTTPSTTSTQQPSQQGTQQGWQWWNDDMARDMGISSDDLKELRGVDDRYRKDYNALGATPWTNAGYQSLSDRRNADMKKLLTADQYQLWTSRTQQERTPSNSKTTAPTR